ncbi:MAG: bleomycin resistance family protein [Pseudopedobacter saltans]|uniref:Bleomycin resistance family protein n=1 Tax=Pseudopedobacter saltans TaxID=151895 RepID=A0A2W5EPS7_9SPHI|nr:MAG: bleomycin resistance family protein [Pseudopedobacter saltans]
MKFNALRPILWTEQLEETIQFYCTILDFHIGEQNADWGWASLYKDDVEIMLSLPNKHEGFDKPKFTGSFYFNVENVEEVWSKIKDKTNICYPIEIFEWGMREFAIYDNNGYILQFGQEIE